jgi:DNA-directed RNA polymerase subunit M/transcription elongation factor TFIIS
MKVISPTPPCPKCKSYLYMIRLIDGVYYRKCRNCGYKKRQDKIDFKKAVLRYLERFMFWKS